MSDQDPECMSSSTCSTDTASAETIRSDTPLSSVDISTEDKVEPPIVDETAVPQYEESVPSAPPINRLPTEILIRIFEFAQYQWRTKYMRKERTDSPAVWDRSVLTHMALGYPETLSQVCSLWRELVLSSPLLWTLLELYTLGRSPQTFQNRCSAFLPRTQDRELGLIIRFRHCDDKPLLDLATMSDFCSSLGPRLRSFSIDNLASNDTASPTSIIQAILPHIIPGTLTKLYIKDHIARIMSSQRNNIEGLAGWELPTAETLGMTQERLDSILRPIKSLRLSGQFFPWSSPAYHGLVELHLLCTRPDRGHRPFIHISRLRETLLACPELRIFYISINITGYDRSLALPPVPLKDLEELSLRGLSRSLYEAILPLIAPGPKPLQLTIRTQPTSNAPLYCPTVLSFLQRANVTSLYVLNRPLIDQDLDINQLLNESPTNLRTLGLERLRITNIDLVEFDCTKPAPIQLQYLCLRKCTINTSALNILAKVLPAQILKLHEPEIQGITSEEIAEKRQEIASIYPTVKWVRSSRDMELWNAWEVEYID